MKSLAIVLLLLMSKLGLAADHAAALQRYLTDEVLAVAYLDLSQIDALGALEWAEKFGMGPARAERAQAVDLMLAVQAGLDDLTDAGARYVYVLFRVSDVSFGGPTWVVPVSETGNSHAVVGMILSDWPDRFEFGRDWRPRFFPTQCEAVKDAVLGANSPTQLKKLKLKRPTIQRDLSEAWKSLGTGHCGLIVFGDEDSRRVVREMFPKLPAPFQEIDGELIADQLLWGGFVAALPPEPRLQTILQTDQGAAAEILQRSAADGLTMLTHLPVAQQSMSAADLEALAKSLIPGVSGDQLTILFDDQLSDLDRIARLLTPPVRKARQVAQRNTRIKKFKQIVRAMLNYESAKGHYPPLGTYADDGKPLLSWRVLILPYLDDEELALYKRFHLDEPWDSEHNKQLIPLMPEVYADPDPAVSRRNAAGRTKYLVPTGPGTVFAGSEGSLLKDITDGLSNTIVLVEVANMASPAWTQPKDWLVDYGNRWERLHRDDRDGFTAAYCDGSVQIMPFSTSAETLRRLVQIADGELVERP